MLSSSQLQELTRLFQEVLDQNSQTEEVVYGGKAPSSFSSGELVNMPRSGSSEAATVLNDIGIGEDYCFIRDSSNNRWYALGQSPVRGEVEKETVVFARKSRPVPPIESKRYDSLVLYIFRSLSENVFSASLPSCTGDSRYRRLSDTKCQEVCGGEGFETLQQCKEADWYEDWPFQESETINIRLLYGSYGIYNEATNGFVDVNISGPSPIIAERFPDDPNVIPCGFSPFFIIGTRGFQTRNFFFPFPDAFDYDVEERNISAGYTAALRTQTDSYGEWRYGVVSDGFANPGLGPPYYMFAGIYSPLIQVTVEDIEGLDGATLRDKLNTFIEGIVPPTLDSTSLTWSDSSAIENFTPGIPSATLILNQYDPICVPPPIPPDDVDEEDPDYREDVATYFFDNSKTDNFRVEMMQIRETDIGEFYLVGIDNSTLYVVIKHGTNNEDETKFKKITIFTFNSSNEIVDQETFTYPDPVAVGKYRKIWSPDFLFSFDREPDLNPDDYYANNPDSPINGKIITDRRIARGYYAPEGPTTLVEAESGDSFPVTFFEVKSLEGGGFDISEIRQVKVIESGRKIRVDTKSLPASLQWEKFQTIVYEK